MIAALDLTNGESRMNRYRWSVFVVVPMILVLTPLASGGTGRPNGEVCFLPVDFGDPSCDGDCPAYFYNTDTKRCEMYRTTCCVEPGTHSFHSLEACERTCFGGAIPAISTWGLVILVLLIMITAKVVFRRASVAT